MVRAAAIQYNDTAGTGRNPTENAAAPNSKNQPALQASSAQKPAANDTHIRNAFVQRGKIGDDTRGPYQVTTQQFGASDNRPTVSDSFNQQYQTAGVRGAEVSYTNKDSNQTQKKSGAPRNRIVKNDLLASRSNIYDHEYENEAYDDFDLPITGGIRKIASRQKILRTRAWVSSINYGLHPILLMYYLGIQIPLAIAGMVFIAFSAALQSIFGEVSFLGRVYDTIVSAIDSLFGTSFGSFTFAGLGMAILLLLFMLGFVIFIMLLFTYLLLGIRLGVRPVFGSGVALKIAALSLCIFYMIPLFNLLPLHIPYMYVIKRYPK